MITILTIVFIVTLVTVLTVVDVQCIERTYFPFSEIIFLKWIFYSIKIQNPWVNVNSENLALTLLRTYSTWFRVWDFRHRYFANAPAINEIKLFPL